MNESTQALPKEHPRIALLHWQVLDLPVDEDYRALLLKSIDTWREQILERPLYARDEGWDDLEALQQVTLGEMMERGTARTTHRQRRRRVRCRRPRGRQRPLRQKTRHGCVRCARAHRRRRLVGEGFLQSRPRGGMHARRLAKFAVGLGLASEAKVTLQCFPGDGEALVVDIETPAGQGVSAQAVSRCVDLTLERSGEDFPVVDLVEVARWGHFEKADYPWEQARRI